jgi:enamine deaminase RidA (YjgF/YER057c/UK114 family)
VDGACIEIPENPYRGEPMTSDPHDPDALLDHLLGEHPPIAPSSSPVASWIRSGRTIYTSGQVSRNGLELTAEGHLGAEVDTETGARCARQAAINVLAIVRAAAGGLVRVERIVKLTVFVASTPGYTDQPTVANGASELIIEVLGERGRHARSAVGVASLPLGAPVEIEAIVEIAS